MEPHIPDSLQDPAVVRAVHDANHGVTCAEAQQAYAQFEARHAEDARQRTPGQIRRGLQHTRHPMWRAAFVGVAVAMIVTTGIVYRAAHGGAEDVHPSRTFATRTGERADITLRDGTHVILAPQSTLTMRGNLGSLVGEAFFTVQHRAESPLIIRTGHITTRVLGTAFDVRRYAGDSATRVVVLEGKVAVKGAQTTAITRGTVATVTDSTTAATTTGDPSQLTRWTQNQLFFRDAPVDEVLHAIERWYGVAFRVTDPAVQTYRLTTVLDTRRTRSETLAALELTLNVQMSAVGDTITLSARSAKPPHTMPRNRSSFLPPTEFGR